MLCEKVSPSKLLSVKFGLLTIIQNTFHLNDEAVSGVLGVCNEKHFPETDHILFLHTQVFVEQPLALPGSANKLIKFLSTSIPPQS